jgi:hypothetical protein
MPASKGYNTRAYVSNPPAAFAIILSSDFGSIQAALPSIAANETADYFAFVPNSGSQWKIQKAVEYMKSDDSSLEDPAGIVLTKIDCIAPAYPGVSTVVSTGAVMVLNGYAFKATSGGTTAASFIGFSNFNTVKGATTTDGSVTWTSYGKAAWLRFRFANVSVSSGVAPVAQAYELFQL